MTRKQARQPEQLSLIDTPESLQDKVKAVIKNEILRAEATIASAGFSYKLKHPDGREVIYDPHGLFDPPKTSKTIKRVEGEKHGDISIYVKDYLNQLKNIGDVVCIPADKYGMKRVRSVASSVAGNMFGKASENGGTKTHSTYTNTETNCVEVMLHIAPVSDEFLNSRVETNQGE
jgi:hypothetical protein